MTERALPATAILAAGVGIGFAGDQLLWESAGPGLNVFLLFVGLAASIWIVTRSGESALSREATWWIVTGLLCGVGLLWRGSGLVRVLSFFAACTAFALPAFDAGRAWTRRSGILDVLASLAGAGLHAAFGGARLVNGEHWAEVAADTGRGVAGKLARTALVGVLLAVVPLTVFGGLFISADAMFATIVGDFVRIDLQAYASHLVLIAVLSWLACGYLVGISSGTKLDAMRRLQPALPKLGVAEVGTALALVDLLFLAFVVVQFRYLFGGGSWVEVTPGLTYADYARAGFFQLVAAVALAMPWLLGAHALLDGRGLRARSVFSAFAGVHLILLLVIVASAVQRMQAYQAAYGLTEERVAVTAALAWLTVVVLWFGATVLSGRRERFVFGGLVTAYLLVAALQLINPAGLVARHNLARMEELGGVDVAYLTAVGSDAAPLLLDRLDELSLDDQCVVARRLLRAWGPDRAWDWRSFNWSDSRARSAVHDDFEALRAVVGRPSCTVR